MRIVARRGGKHGIKAGRMGERRYELDWLRVLAVLLLIFFHSGRVFDLGDFYVKNSSLSEAMEGFITFIDLWFMPLFFFIAGAAAYFALMKRSGKTFLFERTKRLLVPFVFGMLVIIPPQIFCVYLQKPGNPASWIAFWKYQVSVPPLTQITAGKVGDALITAFTWETGHLWFILYLFVFCLLAFPLLKSMKEGRLRGPGDRLAAFCERRSWGVFLLAFPVIVATIFMLLLDDDTFGRLFLVFPFLIGFLVYSNPGFGRAIDRVRVKALALAVAGTVLLAVVLLVGDVDTSSLGVSLLLFGPWIGLETWLWILSFVGLARKYLNFDNRTLAYANEGSYPFYILHQTVIVALALGIVELNTPFPLKYALLVLASLVLTAATYDALVRRWRATRFLFGMRPLKKRAAERLPDAA